MSPPSSGQKASWDCIRRGWTPCETCWSGRASCAPSSSARSRSAAATPRNGSAGSSAPGCVSTTPGGSRPLGACRSAHPGARVGPAIAMPDIHWGYGFPIGGVAAFDEAEGVVSPGGVGYDINCGVRLLATPLTLAEARPRLRQLVDTLYATIPSGVGASRSDVRLARSDLEQVLRQGARWAVEQGYGDPADLEAIEANGTLPDADPDCVSDRAKERGKSQLGTVGSGNHFVEVGYVAERYDERVADRLGLGAATVTVFIHSGSRGLGYQVCDDHLDLMLKAAAKYGIALPDRQLCCAPLGSAEGKRYWGAMNAAANYAFANRQLMAHYARRALGTVFGPTCHGAGRRLSRHKAKQLARPRNILKELEAQGILIRAATRATVDEEMPEAYKDVARVVDVVDRAGIGKKVAQLKPVGVVKG